MERPEIKRIEIRHENVLQPFAILPEADLMDLIDYAKWAERKLNTPDRYNTWLTRRIEDKITQLEREATNARYFGKVTDLKRAIFELKNVLSQRH